jgi:hypothetical protein
MILKAGANGSGLFNENPALYRQLLKDVKIKISFILFNASSSFYIYQNPAIKIIAGETKQSRYFY